jgi:two-component system, chemotaxis family, CheB/CheR fusion protein
MLKDIEAEGATPSSKQFLVVGIGGSAGGLNAFKQLIQAIPVDSGMAYIIVQHLDPTHDSILSELLQKFTFIPVQEVTDNIKVKPDNIYVIPSNKLLTATDGILILSKWHPKSHNLRPIDLFFRSLAEIHQSQAIGVVMSGTGDDGTLGLEAIKKQGGITFAQHHQSATFNEMPQNAVNAHVVDFILPPEGIVHQLIEFSTIFAKNTISEKAPDPRPEDVYYRQILNLVDLQKGVDFIYYKQTTIRRRITRRMVLRNLATFEDYFEYLKITPSEVDTLFQDILIPVTEFFRDPATFDNLCNTYLPALIKTKKDNDVFRVWSVGCSTGQEAFSLAICLFEFFSSHTQDCKLQIFATDISETAIIKARSGFYSVADVESVSPARLEKFFTRTEGGYRVNKVIRDMCIFANHNVLTNPPFASIDLVSCRNVLIYMDVFLQRKAMAAFHYSLNDKGLLLLGKSESTGNSADLFAAYGGNDKVYSRNPVPGRFMQIAARRKVELLANGDLKPPTDNRPNDDFQKSADEIVLSNGPPGVIVNDRYEILQFRGATGEWIEAPAGKPSMSVLKMAKHGLSVDIRTALHKAKTSRKPFTKEGITLETSNGRKLLTLEVTPILNTINTYYLILFRNTSFLPSAPARHTRAGKIQSTSHESRANRLERELLQTREDMRVIVEDQDSGNEELLSTNEELLSGSEELRSLNEELEISKEEMQSTVEELSVANQELSFRNDELTYFRQYSEAIITTISQPLIVLDKELQIKTANAAFYKSFEVREKELLNKPFYEIDDSQWNITELRNLLSRTLSDSSFHVSYELKQDFRRIGQRVLLLTARKVVNESNSEQLILLIIEDITDRKVLEESIRSKAAYARTTLDSNPTITVTASAKGEITYFNKFFLDYAGIGLDDALMSGWGGVTHPTKKEEVGKAWTDAIAAGLPFYKELFLRRNDGSYRCHMAHAIPLMGQDGAIASWVCSASDIHDQRMFTDELEKQIGERTQALNDSNNALSHSNRNLEQFAFIASHDLQEPLRKIKMFTNMLSLNYLDALPREGKTLIEKIHAASTHLSTLIRDVLQFSRIENSESAFVTTDLNAIVKNVIGDFALLISEKNAIVQADNLPPVEVIPIQMSQLFYNLLSNSLKFCSHTEQPKITIGFRNLAHVEVLKKPTLNPKLKYFEILFADNGIGFDERYSEKIFEIFQRLHHHDHYSGTGIGLALCKKIIENHRGLIFAESHEQAGSLFHIILPLNDHHPVFELLPGYVE